MTAFKKSKAGAKTKISREIIETICTHLKYGNYVETAAAMADVSKTSYYAWIKIAHAKIKDGKKTGLHIELLNAVEQAIAISEARDVQNIDKCAMGVDPEYLRYDKDTVNQHGDDISGHLITDLKGKPIPTKVSMLPDWSASAWRLQRKNADRWGNKETVDHTSDDGSVTVNFITPTHKEKE